MEENIFRLFRTKVILAVLNLSRKLHQDHMHLRVTGIRISELLPLSVVQLETLLKEGWVSINRLKKGPANHKAFLTREGKKLVKGLKKVFGFLCLI